MAELKEIDPALASQLRSKLISPDTDITERYRVLFSLRNVKGEVAQDALVQCGCSLHSGETWAHT